MMCYLITVSDGFQKIGRTNNLKRRLFNLQTGSAKPLTVKSEISSNQPNVLEKYLHHRYNQYRRAGEWFQLPESELAKWHCKGFIDFDQNKQITLCSEWIKSILTIESHKIIK